jgi:predicted small lipoprotein YifL
MRKVAVLVLLAALAACGQRSALGLNPGQELPPAPYGREEKPNSSELLEPPTTAIPERSVELRTRSEEREDDPFDLPPPEAPQPDEAEQRD